MIGRISRLNWICAFAVIANAAITKPKGRDSIGFQYTPAWGEPPEVDASVQLDLPRRAERRYLAEVRTIDVGVCRRADLESRVIRQVEELQAQLDIHPLLDGCALDDIGVDIAEIQAAASVAQEVLTETSRDA